MYASRKFIPLARADFSERDIPGSLGAGMHSKPGGTIYKEAVMAHQNLTPQNNELIKKMEGSPLSPAQWLILLLQNDEKLMVLEELLTALLR